MKENFGQIFCQSCNQSYDLSHLAFWVDGEYKCPGCFKSVAVVYSREPLVINSIPAERGASLMILIIDGLYIAGVQRHCLYLLQTFRDLGVDVLLIAVEGGGAWAERFFSLATCSIVATPRIPLTWNNIIELEPQILQRNILSASVHLQVPCVWAVNNVPSNIKIIANLHSEPSEHEIFSAETFSKIATQSYKIIFPAQTTMDAFMKASDDFARNRNKLFVLPNHTYKSGRSKKSDVRNNSDALKIAVISRIDSDKFSMDLFIETIVKLKEQIRFIVKIAGNGELFGSLKERVNALKLEELVYFEGFVNDIERIYEWADIIFLPSKRESMPYVLLEALDYRVPIVLPDYGFVSCNKGQYESLNAAAQVYAFETNNAADASGKILLASKNPVCAGGNDIANLGSDDGWIKDIKELYLEDGNV